MPARIPEVRDRFHLVLLLCALSLSACATVSARPAYTGRDVAGFAESLGYAASPDVDPALGVDKVKVLPSQRSAKELFVDATTVDQHRADELERLHEAFKSWCGGLGGELQVGLARDAEFTMSAVEYWNQRIKRQRELARAEEPGAYSCWEGTPARALGGYVSIDDTKDTLIAFYDPARLTAFVATFLPAAKEHAATRQVARLEEAAADQSRRNAAAAERRSRDPNPASEPERAQLAETVAALLQKYGVFETFSYLGSCEVDAGRRGASSTVFLGKLDRRGLTNAQWVDVPTVGIVYHLYLSDGGVAQSPKLSIKDKGAAEQVVQLVDRIAATCGAK